MRNWHTLNWETEERTRQEEERGQARRQERRGLRPRSLGEMASSRNLVVINDEAHHAWRIPAESKIKGVKKEDIEEATKWVGGLDRIHSARNS